MNAKTSSHKPTLPYWLIFCTAILVSTADATEVRRLGFEQDSIDTRFGRVEILRRPYGDGDALLVNGKEEFATDGDVLALRAHIKQETRDVVVFMRECAGAGGCTWSWYQFLILEAGKPTHVLTHQLATASPYEKVGEATVDGEKVVVDLGFKKQMRKTGILEGDSVKVVLETTAITSLNDEDCMQLREGSRSVCSKYAESDCTGPFISPSSVFRGMDPIQEKPGYNHEAFRRHCIATCVTGQRSSYESFAHEVCGK